MNQNSQIFSEGNVSENVICLMAAIQFRPQYVEYTTENSSNIWQPVDIDTDCLHIQHNKRNYNKC